MPTERWRIFWLLSGVEVCEAIVIDGIALKSGMMFWVRSLEAVMGNSYSNLCRQAAIHRNGSASDISAFVGGQEKGCVGSVPGIAHVPKTG